MLEFLVSLYLILVDCCCNFYGLYLNSLKNDCIGKFVFVVYDFFDDIVDKFDGFLFYDFFIYIVVCNV